MTALLQAKRISFWNSPTVPNNCVHPPEQCSEYADESKDFAPSNALGPVVLGIEQVAIRLVGAVFPRCQCPAREDTQVPRGEAISSLVMVILLKMLNLPFRIGISTF